MLHIHNARNAAAPVISQFAPSAHRIQRAGLGYARPLSDDEIRHAAPAIYADAAHCSRSERFKANILKRRSAFSDKAIA